MSIISRILLISENEDIKITALEKKLGASKGVFSRAAKQNTDIQSKWITTLVENYPQYNAEWLLTGKGDMFKSEVAIMDRSEGIPPGAVPYWDLPVSAGHSVVDIIGSKDPVGYIKNLPGIELAEHILPITGMSMEPEVSNGAIIGVRKIDNWETLNTERIYLIITCDDRMIKRIEHDPANDNILWCVSPNYPKFKIFKSDIIEIQRVCFVYNPR